MPYHAVSIRIPFHIATTSNSSLTPYLSYLFLLNVLKHPASRDILKSLAHHFSDYLTSDTFMNILFELVTHHELFQLIHFNPAYDATSLQLPTVTASFLPNTYNEHLENFHAFSYATLSLFSSNNADLYLLSSSPSGLSTIIRLPKHLTILPSLPSVFSQLFLFTNSSILTDVVPLLYNPMKHFIRILARQKNYPIYTSFEHRLSILKPVQFTSPIIDRTRHTSIQLHHYSNLRSYFMSMLSHDPLYCRSFSGLVSGTFSIFPLWTRSHYTESFFKFEIPYSYIKDTSLSTSSVQYPTPSSRLLTHLGNLPYPVLHQIMLNLLRSCSSCTCTLPFRDYSSYSSSKLFISHPVFSQSRNESTVPFCTFFGIISTFIADNHLETFPLDKTLQASTLPRPYHISHYKPPTEISNHPYSSDETRHINIFSNEIFPTLSNKTHINPLCDHNYIPIS